MKIKQYDKISKAVDDLIPYARNARTHSQEQVAQIAASIKEFGFTNPVIIDESNGIIAGHGRLLAAQKLGLKDVPCIVVSGWSDAQKRAYVIADNKLALNADWDTAMLSLELQELQGMDFDLDLTGFSAGEIEDLILGEVDLGGDNPYSQSVESPNYTPTGEKPEIGELYDDGRYKAFYDKVDALNIQEDEKNFLKMACSRHIVFNYDVIANYYAHSNADVQDVMEDLALIIIDFNKAIELGYVALNKDLDLISEKDHEDQE